MLELPIDKQLVGQRVCNPARPEWGIGEVLRVQTTTVGGETQHRVSIQFPTGHRTLQVPPARLATPGGEPERQQGWLDQLAGNTLDDRLTKLPPVVTEFLGTHAQRLAVLARLYRYSDAPASLERWARDQTRAADPLSLWSRDELVVAFGKYCIERDAELRITAARLKATEGQGALEAALNSAPPELREGMLAALRRPI